MLNNRLNPLLSKDFCGIVGAFQKRNRKISSRSLSPVSANFVMNYPVMKAISAHHFFAIKETLSIWQIYESMIIRDINEGTKPPKIKTGKRRVGILVYQSHKWFEGKRGDWELGAA
mgnify:CR=1 FL=1